MLNQFSDHQLYLYQAIGNLPGYPARQSASAQGGFKSQIYAPTAIYSLSTMISSDSSGTLHIHPSYSFFPAGFQ